MMPKMLDIKLLKLMAGVAMLIFAAMIMISLSSCSTPLIKFQATADKGEIPECYYARYHAHEGDYSTAAKYADACMKISRESGCAKTMKEHPDLYKDFNDCWKTRE